MGNKKLLDFKASISDVKQVNPLFSTCKVRVLYTGKNRNMSIITKDAVEKALPTLKNIPIVGEYSEENSDYKGHGGAIDLDSYKFIHTTKPYGVVPESATYSWEEVKGRDGATREYLTIHGCYLWTGRYEEAYSIIENGKGQSMEIEVTDGRWDEEQEAYQIDNFTFSALCILGDEVEPAFEDASITAYSLDKDSFKQEFTKMLSELKTSLSDDEKEVNDMLKELLEKYSTTMEVLTAKGLNFSEISEDELEAKIAEALEVEIISDDSQEDNAEDNVEDKGEDKDSQEDSQEDDADSKGDDSADVDPENAEDNDENAEDDAEDKGTDAQADTQEDDEADKVNAEELQQRIADLEGRLAQANEELEELREFKLNTEKADHEAKAQKLFSDFQLTESDIEGLDVHKFSIEQIEEKCYAILGRKMASKKNFLKQKDNGSIRLPLGNEDIQKQSSPYGDLLNQYND